jgi:hypothetical protein
MSDMTTGTGPTGRRSGADMKRTIITLVAMLSLGLLAGPALAQDEPAYPPVDDRGFCVGGENRCLVITPPYNWQEGPEEVRPREEPGAENGDPNGGPGDNGDGNNGDENGNDDNNEVTVSGVEFHRADDGTLTALFSLPGDAEVGSELDLVLNGTDQHGDTHEVRQRATVQENSEALETAFAAAAASTGNGASGGDAGSSGSGGDAGSSDADATAGDGEDAAASPDVTPISDRTGPTGVAATVLLLVVGGAMLFAARARSNATG